MSLKSCLKHYLSVYKQFALTSTSAAMSFRTSFVLLVIMDLLFYATTLLSVDFIYRHVETIGPWQRPQLLFFVTFMLAIDQIHMTVVSENYWVLTRMIRTGELDFVLLKPIGSIFSCFFRHFRVSTAINSLVVWALLVHFGIQAGLEWYDWPLLPFLIFIGFILLILIEFNASVAMFWITEGHSVNFLRLQMQNLARWPDFVYNRLSRRVLTLAIPLLLIASPPVHFIFDKGRWPMLLATLIAIVMLALLLKILWRLGLRRYDSASS